jgi:signal transduction histidine kinase
VEIQLGAPVHGQVELRVLDTGPGITPELLPRLFEPFVSSKETGLGLGLAVSRRIAESHGGNLWVTNPPHGGACFVLRLPVVAPNALVLTGAA